MATPCESIHLPPSGSETEPSCQRNYCTEVQQFLNGTLKLGDIQPLVKDFSKEFQNKTPKQKKDSKTKIEGEEGRRSFNYIFLDPRVIQNLPERDSELAKFRVFIDEIFYVGKGTGKRPYDHFSEARKNTDGVHPLSKRIWNIWKSERRVVLLQCFNNCTSEEALTKEALMIEAIGKENLTNKNSGKFYGTIDGWEKPKKLQAGIYFLNEALREYLREGGKEIGGKDVKKRNPKDLESVSETLKSSISELQNENEALITSLYLFTKHIVELVQTPPPSCPMCKRSFQTVDEAKVLISDLEDKQKNVFSQLKSKTELIAEKEKKLTKMLESMSVSKEKETAELESEEETANLDP